jgi:hypothetical protein
MADTGITYPNTATDLADNANAWTNINNVKANDSNYATGAGVVAQSPTYNTVTLCNDNSVIGNNLANSDAIIGTETIRSYGGSDNVWGASLTPTIVNSSTFGVRARIKRGNLNYFNTIEVTGFGFAIDSDQTINGVLAEISAYSTTGARVAGVDYVNYIRITVYYSAGASNDAGCAVSDLQGNGVDAIIYVDTGISVSDLQGSGADVIVYTETGSATSSLRGSGADVAIRADAGRATSDLQGGGADVIIYTDAGIATANLRGSGAGEIVFDDSGNAIGIWMGSGADAITYVDAGIAISDLRGSGAYFTAYIETGLGTITLTGLEVNVVATSILLVAAARSLNLAANSQRVDLIAPQRSTTLTVRDRTLILE